MRPAWKIRLVASVVAAVTVMAPGVASAAGRSSHQPPPAPTELTVEGYGEAVLLSWQPPPGERVRSFRVYDGGTVIVARNTTTSVRVGNLGFARSYRYTVTAVDSRGQESPHSAALSRTLGISGAPPQCFPSGLTQLSVARVTASAVVLQWTNTGDRGIVTVTGGPAGPVSTGLAGAHIGGLAPATSYTFSVAARHHCPWAPPPPATVTVVTPPDAVAARPQAPVAPSVAAQGDTWLRLSWQRPAGGTPATRYVVYQGARPVAATNATSVRVRGLYHAARYAFTVVAVDARGNESTGAEVAGSTVTCQSRPPRPVDVTARALSASSVRLDWVQEAAAVSYTVYDGDAPVGTSVGTATVVSGLPSASAHRFRVVATLAAGCGTGPASAAVAVRTPAGPTARPTRPDGLRLVFGDPNTGTVRVRWNQPADGAPAAAYRIYNGADVVATAAGPESDIRLPQATTQVLTVVAVSSDGLESAQSAPLSVRVPYLPPP